MAQTVRKRPDLSFLPDQDEEKPDLSFLPDQGDAAAVPSADKPDLSFLPDPPASETPASGGSGDLNQDDDGPGFLAKMMNKLSIGREPAAGAMVPGQMIQPPTPGAIRPPSPPTPAAPPPTLPEGPPRPPDTTLVSIPESSAKLPKDAPVRRFKDGNEMYLALQDITEPTLVEYPGRHGQTIRRVMAPKPASSGEPVPFAPPPTYGEMLEDTPLKGPVDYIADQAVPALKTGALRLAGSMARIPNLTANTALSASPAGPLIELVRKKAGLPPIKDPAIFEQSAQWWDEKTKQADVGAKRWGDKGENLISVVKRKDPKEIAEFLAYQVISNVPQQALVVGATVAGAPHIGMAAMGATSAADALKEGREKGASRERATSNAVLTGTIETAFERLGTFGLMNKWGDALKTSFGKGGATQIIKNTLKAIFATTVGEANEEFWTSLAQNLSKVVTGVDPKAMKGAWGQAVEALTVGAASGLALTGPGAIVVGAQRAAGAEANAAGEVAAPAFNKDIVNAYLEKVRAANEASAPNLMPPPLDFIEPTEPTAPAKLDPPTAEVLATKYPALAEQVMGVAAAVEVPNLPEVAKKSMVAYEEAYLSGATPEQATEAGVNEFRKTAENEVKTAALTESAQAVEEATPTDVQVGPGGWGDRDKPAAELQVQFDEDNLKAATEWNEMYAARIKRGVKLTPKQAEDYAWGLRYVREHAKQAAMSGQVSDPRAAAPIPPTETKTAPPNAPDETALKAAADNAGVVYRGIQVDANNNPDLVLFNDPISRTTLALPVAEATPEAIQAKVQESRLKLNQIHSTAQFEEAVAKAAPQIPRERVKAAAQMADGLATWWEKYTGQTKEDYYKQAFAGVFSGDVAGKKGAVEFLENKRALIQIMKNADESTVIHELWHGGRRDLYKMVEFVRPELKPRLMADIATVEEWAGVKDGVWTKESEEKFARGFEHYVATGQAPRPELQRVFDMFKDWLSGIYGSIKGSSIDVEVSPKVRAVFDRMLGAADGPAPGSGPPAGTGVWPGTLYQEEERRIPPTVANVKAIGARTKAVTPDKAKADKTKVDGVSLEKDVNEIPIFQGGKRELATRVGAGIMRQWSDHERKSITSMTDAFGGSGGWGLWLANHLFPNAKTININELNPDRLSKIKFFHERGKDMRRLVYEAKLDERLGALYDDMAKAGVQSGSALGGRLEKMVEQTQDETERAMIMAIVDYVSHQRGVRTVNDALEAAVRDADYTYKAAAKFRARGGTINYRQGDAYTLEPEAGSKHVVVFDPPYYGTAGYGTGTVPMSIYKRTGDFLAKVTQQKNHVVYTDSLWFEKPVNELPHDWQQGALDVYRKIEQSINGLGSAQGKVGAGRQETIGFNNAFRPSPQEVHNAETGREGGPGSDPYGAGNAGGIQEPGVYATGSEEAGIRAGGDLAEGTGEEAGAVPGQATAGGVDLSDEEAPLYPPGAPRVSQASLNRLTGVTPPAEPKLYTRTQVYRATLQRAAYAAAQADARARKEAHFEEGWKIGEVQAIKETVKAVVERLPLSERGRFLATVVNAKTPKHLIKAISRVDAALEKYQKRTLTKAIKRQFQRFEASKQIAVDYIDKIRGVMDGILLQKPRAETLAAVKETQKYIEQRRAEGENVSMPQYVMDRIRHLAAQPLADMSVAQIEDVLDHITTLAQLGKTKLRAMQEVQTAQKKADMDALVADASPIIAKELERAKPGESLTMGQSLSNYLRRVTNVAQNTHYAITPMDVIFDILDGSQNYGGANYRIFKGRVDTAFNAYQNAARDIRDAAKTAAKGLNEKNMERIGVYAIAQQEGGGEKLLNNGMTPEEIAAIQLTPPERAFYLHMRRVFDTLRPKISEIMRKLYNKELGQVENYFPFITDWEVMGEQDVRDRMLSEMQGLRRSTEKGFTEGRKGAGDQKVNVNAMDVFIKHVDDVAYLLEMGPTAKYLGELASSDAYGDAAGNKGQQIVREWVDTVARKGGGMGDQQIKILDFLRRNAGLAGLGLRLSTTMLQFTPILQGASLIGPRAFKGAMNVALSPKWRAFLTKNLPEIRERAGDDPAFRDFSGDSIKDKYGRMVMWQIKQPDLLMAASVASGAYEKYLADHGETLDFDNPNQAAIEYAQRIVRRSQSTGIFKDVPQALSRGRLTGNISLDKALLQFQSFMMNDWSLLTHEGVRAGLAKGNVRQSFNIFLFAAISALMTQGIYKMLRRLMGKEEPDEEEWQKWLKAALFKVPFIGQMYGMAVYGSSGIPALDVPAKAFMGGYRAATGKSDKTRVKGAADAAVGLSTIMGVPIPAQIAELMKSLYDKGGKGGRSGMRKSAPTRTTARRGTGRKSAMRTS